MSSQLIVALDFAHEQDALNLVDKLDPQKCALKVGNELFTLFGTQFVKQLIARQFKVFLDLKFHDIPNTVANACKAGADLGVWMMNVDDAFRKASNRTLRSQQTAPYRGNCVNEL
jgi:orotidine-5'-phosphate decarboxylase